MKEDKKLNFLQKFAHNALGWGYIDENCAIECDIFQPTYTCLCGSKLAHDSN